MTDLLNSVTGLGGNMMGKAQGVIDRIFPPEKRAEMMTKLQMFAANNPKLSAFLLCQIALTGFPLAMFIVFTVTVFVFSLIAALLIGILVALVFTVFMVFTALLVVLPITFLTTMAASFVFLWGLGGYYLLKWFNKGESPAASGNAIGDKINNLTGGRMSFLMDSVRGSQKEADMKEDDVDEKPEKGNHQNHKPQKLNQSNGGLQKNMDPAKLSEKMSKVGNVDNVTKQANLDGATKKVSNVTNTAGSVKGVAGGLTGLS